jgi:hypothetical protein
MMRSGRTLGKPQSSIEKIGYQRSLDSVTTVGDRTYILLCRNGTSWHAFQSNFRLTVRHSCRRLMRRLKAATGDNG